MINVLGLVLGITGTIIIYKVVDFEKSFDQYHTSGDQVYRMNLFYDIGAESGVYQSMVHPLGPALTVDFPDWRVSRIHWYNQGIFNVLNAQQENKLIKHSGEMAFVDPAFFEMFDFDVVAGKSQGLLTEPKTIAISTALADKLFDLKGAGYQEVIGRTLVFENQLNLKIEGVYQDPPKNTDYGLDAAIFYEGAKIYPYANGLTSWRTRNGATRTFVKLPEGQTKDNADLALKAASAKYLGESGYDLSQIEAYHFLQPLSEVHLDPNTGMGNIDQSVLKALNVIAVILILIAAINFINLATAQSVKRAKEVGIRKVLGGGRVQVIFQFLGEVLILTTASVILSLGLSEAALMQLEPFLGYSLGLNLLANPETIFFLIILILSVTLLSGLYPSLILAGYNPINAIRSAKLTARSKKSGMSLRRTLVVFQFLISQILIIGTLVVLFQMNYMTSAPIGFDTANILTFNVPENDAEKRNLLRSRLSSISGVGELSYFVATPGAASVDNFDEIKNPAGSESEKITAVRKNVDAWYEDVFGFEMIAGEFYREDSPEDHTVINRKLSEALGFDEPTDALGTSLENGYGGTLMIVGVMEDFHNRSFRSVIDPVYMLKGSGQYFEAGVQIQSGVDYSSIVDQVNAVWSDIYTKDVFEYGFMDENIVSQYANERKISQLFQCLAGVAIFICFLGLYGLISFMANQKVKEIGIRKVLGASVQQIMMIFSKEVTVLVLIAFVIAAPLAYFVMNLWLSGFEFRIAFGAKIFVIGVLVTFTIAAVTVGSRALTAALTNPVKSLRDE